MSQKGLSRWRGGLGKTRKVSKVRLGSWGVRRILAVGVAALLGLMGFAQHEAAAEDPSFLTLGAGYFDVVHDDDGAAMAGVEWMSDWRLWILQPIIGGMATTDGGIYAYGGVAADIFFGTRWVLTPSVAVGAFDEGSGMDLGNTIEFRSAISFAYRFDDTSRLGLRIYHISNAGLSDNNPGVEVLDFTYSIPLR